MSELLDFGCCWAQDWAELFEIYFFGLSLFSKIPGPTYRMLTVCRLQYKLYSITDTDPYTKYRTVCHIPYTVYIPYTTYGIRPKVVLIIVRFKKTCLCHLKYQLLLSFRSVPGHWFLRQFQPLSFLNQIYWWVHPLKNV